MDKMTMCNMKCVAHSDKPQRIITQLCSFTQFYRTFLAHCFGFRACNFTGLIHHLHSHQCCFQIQQAAVFSNKKKLYKPTVS